MNEKELMRVLEIDNWEEFQYCEQFLTLMDCYEMLEEEILVKIFSIIQKDERIAYIEYYFDDMMIGIPDDNIEVYKIFSTVKSNLLDIAASQKNNRILEKLAFELMRFLRWLTEDVTLECTNLLDMSKSKVNIYDALILLRMEKLNEGKYEIIFPDDLDYSIEEFKNYNEDNEMHFREDEEDYKEDYEDEEDYKEDYEDEEDIFDNLIDPNHPVIEEFQ